MIERQTHHLRLAGGVVPNDYELCKLDEIWVGAAAHDSDAADVEDQR
jgi:hypothetical protein